jgi:hypothetical protein
VASVVAVVVVAAALQAAEVAPAAAALVEIEALASGWLPDRADAIQLLAIE